MRQSAKCHACGTQIMEPEGELILPSVVNPVGDKGLIARVLAYKCNCGRRFTSITYEPRFSRCLPPARHSRCAVADPRD